MGAFARMENSGANEAPVVSPAEDDIPESMVSPAAPAEAPAPPVEPEPEKQPEKPVAFDSDRDSETGAKGCFVLRHPSFKGDGNVTLTVRMPGVDPAETIERLETLTLENGIAKIPFEKRAAFRSLKAEGWADLSDYEARTVAVPDAPAKPVVDKQSYRLRDPRHAIDNRINGTVSVCDETFSVKDGVVEVPPAAAFVLLSEGWIEV